MWTIATTMDDVSDPAIAVFGPFKSKREALAWARRDRQEQADEMEEPDAAESFSQDADTIWFGSFKWTAIKMIKPKKSKRA